VPYCPECGTEIKLGAKFCPECGTRIIEKVPPATVPPPVYRAKSGGGTGKKAIAGVVVLVFLIALSIIFWPQIRAFIDRVIGTSGGDGAEPTTYPDVEFTNYDFNSAFTLGGTWIRIDLDVTVKNKGTANATGVQVTARLYEGSTITEQQTQYIGSLLPNQSISTSFSINGELLHYYLLWFRVSGNEGTFHTVQSQQFQLFYEIDWSQIIDAIVPF